MVIQSYSFFPTNIWVGELDVDNEKLLKRIYKFSKKKKSSTYSNVGGYQGHLFRDKELCDKIMECMPRAKELSSYNFYDWVNINKKGDSNKRHFHYATNLFLSGVYYVKSKLNSGRLQVMDPRPGVQLIMPPRKKGPVPRQLWREAYFEPVPGRESYRKYLLG